MRKYKIVKKITTLTIAFAFMITMISCSSKSNDVEIEKDISQQGTVTDENADVVTSNKEITAEKQEDKIIKYASLDFKTVTDCEKTYETLIKEREVYEEQMQKVLGLKLFYSKEDVTTAIYNVARIDSDLSNLILKIYNQTKEDIKDEKYLADQIEALQKVLDKINLLKSNIETSKKEYSKALDNILEADSEKIEKVHKFALTPLKQPETYLKSEIESLKEELKEALEKQP